MTRCPKCGSPIMFAKNAKGQWTALDPEQSFSGLRFVIGEHRGETTIFPTLIGDGHAKHECEREAVDVEQGELGL